MQNKINVAAEPETASARVPHNLILENRHAATVTGVTRIVSYDDAAACLETQQGGLTIGGKGIQVSELSLQTGELKIYGKIEYVQYTDIKEAGGGFWQRLMR